MKIKKLLNSTPPMPKTTDLYCQVAGLQQISTGILKKKQLSNLTRLKLLLSLKTRRKIRMQINNIKGFTKKLLGRPEKKNTPQVSYPILNLEAGEAVKIRSWNEIKLTLDERNDYKNCGFMAGMKQYAGTKQRVLKPVRIFVDERDLQLKKTKGIVLLEGLMCQGDERYSQCDRSCYYFWREEWLERIEEAT